MLIAGCKQGKVVGERQPPAMAVCTVHLHKPAPHVTWFGRRRRVFMGIGWDHERRDERLVGVPISDTFRGMPSDGVLFGGDVVRSVEGAPVNTDEDIAFLWDRAAPGLVAFEVHRAETHRFSLTAPALRRLQITWLPMAGGAPMVGATNANEQLLAECQLPGFVLPGDLILKVDGLPTATRDAASALLERAAQRDQAAVGDDLAEIEISVRRGCPLPLDGVAPTRCCCGVCCCYCAEVTRVPKPRSANKVGYGANGATLAEMAPPLIE